MLRMIIVDDEEIIRHSLNTLLDWKSLGIEIVALCKNGLEAYDAAFDEYPDIILTDIQMPCYSGLKLIEQLNQKAVQVEFIILSGHDNFSYAQEAMRLGVRHYLLKPCKNQELIAAINDLAPKCIKRNCALQLKFSDKPFINEILHLINTRYMDADLTLKKIAETKLFLSTNYVSKQFQLETGIKFSAYLNEKRIEVAKELLTNNRELKMYEIAEKVGCGNNPKYFSQLFKRHTGQSPTEFLGK